MQNAQIVNSKPESCKGCPYYDQSGPVWGVGHPRARMVLIQDKPSQTGGADRVLDNACRKAGLNKAREFSTYLVKCIPNTPFVHPQAIKQCSVLLRQEMDNLKETKVLVASGAVVFKHFTGKDLTSVMTRKKPTAWLRGCPWPKSDKYPTIIPVMDPQFFMSSGFVTGYQLDMDFQKIARFANGEGRTYIVKYSSSPSDGEIRELIQDLRASGRGGIDIETPEDADEDELRAGGQLLPIEVIGIANRIGEVVGVPPEKYHLLEDLFTNPRHPIKWYVFNGSFDFYHLGKRFGWLRAVRQYDAMLALNRWRSDLMKKDLGILMSFFTDMPFTKNLAKLNPIKYQWADVTGILEGGMNIERCLDMLGMGHVVDTQDHPLHEDLLDPRMDGLNRMRELGIHADVREVMKLTKVSEQMLSKYLVLWNQKFPTIDWQSPQQLFTLFTEVLKLPVIQRVRVKKDKLTGEKVKTKTPTCDVDALEEYRDDYGSKIAGLILQMRLMKHLGDFAGIVAPDQRVHTAYLVHRQVQFRIQAVDPNIQTLPEKIAGFHTRRMVIADDPENDELIAVDGSQCELRIYAWLAKAKNLLAAMDSGIYIYGFMYEQIFGKPFFKEGPKTKYNKQDYVQPAEILAAKSGPLGYIYNRGWESVATKQNIAREIAKASFDGFHSENPEIRNYHAKLDRIVLQQHYLDNLWGGRRYFPLGKNQRGDYLSFMGQSNWGELLRQNYLKPCFKHLPDFGARVLLTVHDSMVVNTPKRNRKAVAQFILDNTEAPIPQMEGFIIPAEVKFGPNWADMELFKTHKDSHGRTVVD